MKISSKELKKRAKQKLQGNYGLCVGIQLILNAIISIVLVIMFFASLIAGILGSGSIYGLSGNMAEYIIIIAIVVVSMIFLVVLVSLFTPGNLKIYLNISENKPVHISDLLYGFKNKPHKFIGLNLIMFLIAMVWSIPYYVVMVVAEITNYIPVMIVLLIITYLLLLIGVTITSLYLAQAAFIFVEAPDKGIFRCFKESVEMMKGHKGSFFYINLSFLGLVLLGYCSFGIAYLWIMPYITATLTEYYNELKPKLIPNPEVYLCDSSYESLKKQEF